VSDTGSFTKRDPAAPPGFFDAEAHGLRWLAEAGCVAVPAVLEVDAHHIVIEAIPTGTATSAGAERFGRDLARLHQRGAATFGAPWPGFIGPLPMDNTEGRHWPPFFAHQRVLPYLRQARDRGSLSSPDACAVEEAMGILDALAGADEGPRRLHGDLWSGNVVWDRNGEAWLIDPAAHGGHRESDLAMLALFGAPHLETILASYEETSPLAEGWRRRVGLHQLPPLLVHAVLFGGGYGARAGTAARRALAELR
jgi:fructosamine-3-kinase